MINIKFTLLSLGLISALMLKAQTTDPGVTSTGNAGGNHAFRGAFTNGTFSNWLNTGYVGTAYNLLGTSDPHAGYGLVTGNNIVSPMIWMYNNNNNAFIVKTMDYLGDMTSGRDLFTVRSTGNVGVGINAPVSTLHIYSNSANTSSNAGLTIEEDGTGDALLHFLLSLEQRWVAGIDNSDNNKFIIGRGADWVQGKDLVISNTGNVGIGIGNKNPAQKLHVKDGNIRFEFNSTYGNDPFIDFQNNGNEADIYQTFYRWSGIASDYNATRFIQNNLGFDISMGNTTTIGNHTFTSSVFFKKNGAIGIGNNNPANRLHLFNLDNDGINLDNKFRIRTSNISDNNFVLEHTANTGNLYIRSIEIGDTSGDLILNDLGGNVGIGTVTPLAKLSVNGDILAEEVKVVADVNAVPDFVFDEGYQLNTLAWTEAYIKANHHLPEIPSAAEISENGLNLGDMELKLLQKIEELTLYIIQQNNEMEAMKAAQSAKEEAISTQLSILMKEIEALKSK